MKKIRPWKFEEVPVGAILRSKETGNISLLVGVQNTVFSFLIFSYNGFYTAQNHLDENEYSIDGGKTWLSCGVCE